MPPITWQTVNNSGAVNPVDALRLSGAFMDRGFGGLSAALGQFSDWRQQQNDQAVIAHAIQQQDPMAYRQDLLSGSVFGGVDRSGMSLAALNALDARAGALETRAGDRARNEEAAWKFGRLQRDTGALDAARDVLTRADLARQAGNEAEAQRILATGQTVLAGLSNTDRQALLKNSQGFMGEALTQRYRQGEIIHQPLRDEQTRASTDESRLRTTRGTDELNAARIRDNDNRQIEQHWASIALAPNGAAAMQEVERLVDTGQLTPGAVNGLRAKVREHRGWENTAYPVIADSPTGRAPTLMAAAVAPTPAIITNTQTVPTAPPGQGTGVAGRPPATAPATPAAAVLAASTQAPVAPGVPLPAPYPPGPVPPGPPVGSTGAAAPAIATAATGAPTTVPPTAPAAPGTTTTTTTGTAAAGGTAVPRTGRGVRLIDEAGNEVTPPQAPPSPKAGGETPAGEAIVTSLAANATRPSEPGTAGTTAGNPHDVVYGGRPTRTPISSMTLGAVDQHQGQMLDSIGHSPVGAYQFTRDTIRDFAPRVFGADWRNVTFDARNQDRLAEAIFNERKGRNLQLTWSTLPNATPGAYADKTWQEMRNEISRREVGQPVDPDGPGGGGSTAGPAGTQPRQRPMVEGRSAAAAALEAHTASTEAETRIREAQAETRANSPLLTGLAEARGRDTTIQDEAKRLHERNPNISLRDYEDQLKQVMQASGTGRNVPVAIAGLALERLGDSDASFDPTDPSSWTQHRANIDRAREHVRRYLSGDLEREAAVDRQQTQTREAIAMARANVEALGPQVVQLAELAERMPNRYQAQYEARLTDLHEAQKNLQRLNRNQIEISALNPTRLGATETVRDRNRVTTRAQNQQDQRRMEEGTTGARLIFERLFGRTPQSAAVPAGR